MATSSCNWSGASVTVSHSGGDCGVGGVDEGVVIGASRFEDVTTNRCHVREDSDAKNDNDAG